MKIRIMGTSEEVKQLAELLPAIMNVSSVSGEYPNRGNSSEVRVYVDGVVETDPFTTVMQQYAATKNQLEGLFMVTASAGEVMQANVATNSRGFLIVMNHLISEDFAQTLKGDMEKFFQDAKSHKESEAPKNAC